MVPSVGEKRIGSVLQVGMMACLGVLYLPLLMMVVFSFNSGRFQVLPFKALTWQWYQRLFTDPAFTTALTHSVVLGMAVSGVATGLGFMAAYSLIKSQFPGKESLASLLVTPIAVPGILLAVALRVYFFQLGWSFSLLTVFWGHLIVGIPLAILILRARLAQIPLSLEEAAWDLGARRLQSWSEVVLPLALPGLVASLLLNFTFSFDEFVMAYFLTQFDLTLPIKIWSNLITGFDPTINAIGTVILGLSLLFGLISQLFLLNPLQEKR